MKNFPMHKLSSQEIYAFLLGQSYAYKAQCLSRARDPRYDRRREVKNAKFWSRCIIRDLKTLRSLKEI